MPFGEYKIQNNYGLSEQDLRKRINPLVADILGYEINDSDQKTTRKLRGWDEDRGRAYDTDEMKMQIRTKIMAEINDKIAADIKKYLFFDPNEVIKKNIFKKALETVIKDAPLNYKFLEEITEIYFDDLGEEIIATALKSGREFHELLVEKFRAPEFAQLGVNREVLKNYQSQWQEKYNSELEKLNTLEQ